MGTGIRLAFSRWPDLLRGALKRLSRLVHFSSLRCFNAAKLLGPLVFGRGLLRWHVRRLVNRHRSRTRPLPAKSIS
jgi:hypothetical protein